MPLALLDLAPQQVLRQYPVVQGASTLVPLGNRGGFSGALLWRVEVGPTLLGNIPALCLRAWPPEGPSGERLGTIHHLMRHARESGLSFVPAVFATGTGSSWVEQAGRLWDVTAWLPGQADFHDRPSPARLEAACLALAHLHAAWALVAPVAGPPPAVRRRIEAAKDWRLRLQSGWRPDFNAAGGEGLRHWAERAWQALRDHIDTVPAILARWGERPMPLQPCLCDLWHDHVLFDGDTVTGLIDYGAVKTDHVTVDLARLLGSLVGSNMDLRRLGCEAYSRVRPLSVEEVHLMVKLDETGTLIAAANWLKWLYHEKREFEDHAAVARRLAGLVERLER
jgi:homoserine kinase type II